MVEDVGLTGASGSAEDGIPGHALAVPPTYREAVAPAGRSLRGSGSLEERKRGRGETHMAATRLPITEDRARWEALCNQVAEDYEMQGIHHDYRVAVSRG